MAIALVLIVVVVGSVMFHLLSPWWWTPIASNWSYIDHTISITFSITGAVFAAVVLFMAYCVFRFRHKEGSRAHYEPENKRLETWLTVATAIGVAAMLTPGLFVWANLQDYIDTTDLLARALREHVAFVPGRAAYLDGRGGSEMRLNFSGVGEDQIREGVRRIGKVVAEQVALYGTLTGIKPAPKPKENVVPLRRREAS